MSLFCLDTLIAHYSHLTFVWGWRLAAAQPAGLRATRRGDGSRGAGSVVMGGQHCQHCHYQALIVILNIFADPCRGHRVQLHPGMSIEYPDHHMSVTPDHCPGPPTRGGDVLQTEAWLVPGPSLPLCAGPGGEVSDLVTPSRKLYILILTLIWCSALDVSLC